MLAKLTVFFFILYIRLLEDIVLTCVIILLIFFLFFSPELITKELKKGLIFPFLILFFVPNLALLQIIRF